MINIREAKKQDFPFVYTLIKNELGYPDLIETELYKRLEYFGNNDDCGVVAEMDGKIVGMAWTRIIPAYGNIDNETPELAISILPEYRNYGVGSKLMLYLFEELSKRGFKRTSLSVQQNNPAVRFYLRLGYIITKEKLDHAGHEDFIMVKELK